MRSNIPNILLMMLSFFCFSCCSSASARKDSSTNKEVPINSFVKITVTINVLECKKLQMNKKVILVDPRCHVGSYSSVGSGISIGTVSGASVILTAGHICEHSVPPFVSKYNVVLKAMNLRYQTRRAIVIKSSLDPAISTDICLLAVPGLATSSVKISSSGPRIGDSVYSLSAPAGIIHPPIVPVFHGIFSGDIRSGQTSIITLRATGGSSGSGVLNRDMELIGILYATHTSFNSVTLMNSRDNTIQFVADSLPELEKKLSAASNPPLQNK